MTVVVVALAGVVTLLGMMLADLVWALIKDILESLLQKEGLSAFEPSVLAIMITDAVIALIFAFLWFGICMKGEWFFGARKDCVKHPPHAFFGVIWLAIVPLAAIVADVWFCWTGYADLVQAVPNGAWFDTVAFEDFIPLIYPAVFVSQLLFMIAIVGHYRHWQRCDQCKHMFCIDYNYTGSESWDTYQYKTKTTRENVGSISVDGRKIADVKGDVTRERVDRTHYVKSNYNGRCTHCQNESYRHSTDIS